MNRTQEDWIKCYEEKCALWLHDGNRKRPHALLTSGLHSSGFFNSELVMEDSLLLDDACFDLAVRIDKAFNLYGQVRVVGPAMGAITLADGLTRHLAKRGLSRECLRAYTEKEGEGENMWMVFKRTTIQPGEKVILCEDVLTTGGSAGKAVQAVKKAGGIVQPYMAVLVNRSGLHEVEGMEIISLIDKPMPTWTAKECPLCEQGSRAIRPKGNENWASLNAEY
jgi:orotate phosphoribosyltransferase